MLSGVSHGMMLDDRIFTIWEVLSDFAVHHPPFLAMRTPFSPVFSFTSDPSVNVSEQNLAVKRGNLDDGPSFTFTDRQFLIIFVGLRVIAKVNEKINTQEAQQRKSLSAKANNKVMQTYFVLDVLRMTATPKILQNRH